MGLDFVAAVGRPRRGRQGMGHQGVDDPRLDLQEQHAEDVFGDLALPPQVGQPAAVQAEVGQPVRALALSLDRDRPDAALPTGG